MTPWLANVSRIWSARIKSFSLRAVSRFVIKPDICSFKLGESFIRFRPNNLSISCQSLRVIFNASINAKAFGEFKLSLTASRIFSADSPDHELL